MTLEPQESQVETRRKNIIAKVHEDESKEETLEEPALRADFTELLDLTTHGLFSRRGHFIYELLQNAEDYNADRVEIQDTGNHIIFKNNANPFDEQDAVNICSVGSHKLPEEGYIGYWGFGFKSVFQVTESPHIISWNDEEGLYYSFKFDRSEWKDNSDLPEPNEAPWQIAPFWVDDPPIDEEQDEFNNIFVLPYPDSERDNMREIIDGQLEPKLLMFLEEIEEIIVDPQGGPRQVMQGNTVEEVLGGRIVELEPEPVDHPRWWVYDSRYTVAKEVREDRMTRQRDRGGITEREVKMAIPLKNREGEWTPAYLTSGSVHTGVFSFLPLTGVEDTGLPFILDADFISEMGRSVPHPSAMWNKWLADVIGGQLIPEVVDQMKKREAWKKRFYPAIIPGRPPNEDQPIFRRIDRRLRGEHEDVGEWLAIVKQTDLDKKKIIYTEDGEWTPRLDTALPEEPEIRHILPPEDLEEYTAYPDPELDWGTEQVRGWLFGDREVGISALIDQIQTSDGWLNDKKSEGVAWFRELYAYLEEKKDEIPVEELQSLDIVYTEDGLTNPSEARLPVQDDDVVSVLTDLNGFENRTLIPEDVLTSEDSESGEDAERFLERELGVCRPTVENVVTRVQENTDKLTAKAEDGDDAWFRKLYAVLSDVNDSNSLQDEPIVYTGSDCKTPTDVYFPSEEGDARELLEQIGKTTDVVNTIPQAVIDSDEDGGADAKTFLNSLDIGTLGVKEVVNEVVLPEITQEDASTENLFQLTQYVKEELDPENLQDEEIVVVTKEESVVPVSDAYLSGEYNPSYDLETVFDEEKEFISPDYTDESKADGEWKDFFVSLGAHDGTSINDLINAVEQFPTLEREDRHHDQIREVYTRLADRDSVDEEKIPEDVMVLTKAGDFRSAQKVYIPDNNKAEEVFGDELFVEGFVEESERDVVYYPPKWLGVKTASAHWQEDINILNRLEESPSPKVDERIDERWENFAQEDDNILNTPPEMVWSETLQPEFRLNGEKETGEAIECNYTKHENTLYCSDSVGVGNWGEVAEAIAAGTNLSKQFVQVHLERPLADDPQRELEQRAVETVMAWERERGRKPNDVRNDDDHNGHDIYSVREGPDGDVIQEREIEIKALSNRGGITLQETQWRLAKDSDQFRLYVIMDPKKEKTGRIMEPGTLVGEKSEGNIDEEVIWKVPTGVIWEQGQPSDFS